MTIPHPRDLPSLSILGTGLSLSPSVDTRAYAASLGADPSAYRGWDRICIATDDDDHPGAMCGRSLQQALEESGVAASDLRIVVAAGMSRDFNPSWSISTEAMKLVGAPVSCIGIDLTIGCLGALAGLSTVLGWLLQEGGGYGAVVCGERWAYTIDRGRQDAMPLWGHSDGGGSIVVGLDVQQRSLGEYRGACFSSYADYNGRVLIRYGGTRFPDTPPGESPFLREVNDPSGSSTKDAKRRYVASYTDVLDQVTERFGVRPELIVVNQVSTGIVAMLPSVAGVAEDCVVNTGHETGHLGPADIVVGLRRLVDQGRLTRPVGVVASTAYAFGAGLVLPPA